MTSADKVVRYAQWSVKAGVAMVRALVLIGVKKTGTLPELQAVDDCIDKMLSWAASQNITGKYLKVLSDKDGEVRAHHVADAVSEMIALGTLEQLIVYFSGHGIHNKGDYWLLSRAPTAPSEAVNVSGSKYLADYCGVPHVVMISDACRTAPAGIQAQGVTGQEIFPNDPAADGEMGAVDLFYSCRRGKPSLEIADPNESKKLYTAIYTDVLVSCLSGRVPAVLNRTVQDNVDAGIVKIQNIANHLEAAVPKELRARLGTSFNKNFEPVAAILSRDAWLSKIVPFPSHASSALGPTMAISDRPRAAARDSFVLGTQQTGRVRRQKRNPSPRLRFSLERRVEAPHKRRGPPRPVIAAPRPPSVEAGYSGRDILRALLKKALGTGLTVDEQLALDWSEQARELSQIADEVKATFGADHFETECGIRIRGKGVKQVLCAAGTAALSNCVTDRDTLVRIQASNDAINTLLEFDDGTSALIPAIPKYVGALTFVESDLIDVSYEPVPTSLLWGSFQERARELRELRAFISASNQAGALQVDQPMSEVLLEKIRYFRTLDPSLGIYACYALHDLGRHKEVSRIKSLLDGWVNMRFFDIEMLSVTHRVPHDSDAAQILPIVPMMSRGWALLRAMRVPGADRLLDLQQHVTESPWTLFDRRGTARLIRGFDGLGNV